MKAKLINEIRRERKISGLEAIGVGLAGIINVPSKLSSLEKEWTWHDFALDRNDATMKSTYSVKNSVHTLIFDYSYLNITKSKIEDPYISYDEEKKTVTVFFGKINGHEVAARENKKTFHINRSEDLDQILDGLDQEWIDEIYLNLCDYSRGYEEEPTEKEIDYYHMSKIPGVGGQYDV